MKDAEWIARANFVLVRQDGARSPVGVRIGAPQTVGPDEWNCRLALEGLYDELPPVSGSDSLQALGLAWRLAGMLLASAEADGGQFEFETGEAVPLAAYFDGPLTPPDVPDQAI